MNVLFILTDQFRFDCLGTLGHRALHTPNLDALAAESTLFTNTWKGISSMPCSRHGGYTQSIY